MDKRELLDRYEARGDEPDYEAALAATPDDGQLTNRLGDALAGEGRSADALDAWRRGFALDPESLEGRYSLAFLLEREGRIVDAIAEWRFIIRGSEERDHAFDTAWPRREIARLESLG